MEMEKENIFRHFLKRKMKRNQEKKITDDKFGKRKKKNVGNQ